MYLGDVLLGEHYILGVRPPELHGDGGSHTHYAIARLVAGSEFEAEVRDRASDGHMKRASKAKGIDAFPTVKVEPSSARSTTPDRSAPGMVGRLPGDGGGRRVTRVVESGK